MNERMSRLIMHRFWLGFVIAFLWGAYVGITYPYPSLFAGNRLLYPELLIPCAVIGSLSGWKTILNCALLHFVVAALFFTRALIGRELTADYVQFVFHLTAGSVLEVLPQALLWGYLSSLVVLGIILLCKKLIGPK